MIEKQIYAKLIRVIPDMESRLAMGVRYGKSKVNGYMDLNYDYLGSRRDGHFTIALSHNYMQNGDVVPDPDMQIRIDTNAKTAEAMTFQNLYVYQEVLAPATPPDPKNEKLRKELNLFLSQWLNNAIVQGHRIDFSEAERELANLRRRDDKNPEHEIDR